MSPQRPGPRALVAGAGAALAAGAGVARWQADRRAIAADPAGRVLAAPLEGRRLAVTARDGTALNALELGPPDAPLVVLVHGWTCALRFWTCQLQALSGDCRVVAYDLRGHGESERARDRDYSIEAHADDLEAVLAAAARDGEPAVVAGHSLGAITLVAWAGRHPDEVAQRLAGAVLVNTGMGDLITESFVLRAPARLDAVRQAVGRTLLSASAPLPKGPTPISHRAVRYVALSPSASPAQVAFCERIVLECPRDVRAANGGTLSRLDLHDAVESLTAPTVVVAGEEDKLTPPPHARRMAQTLPDLVDHVLIPRAGHMAPVSHPDVVTGAIRRLVDRHPAGARAGAGAA